MATFLALAYYRGTLNVNRMRTFDNEDDAHGYVATFGQYEESRVYELFVDKPPRLCKKPKTQ